MRARLEIHPGQAFWGELDTTREVQCAGVPCYRFTLEPPVRMGAHVSVTPVDVYVRADSARFQLQAALEQQARSVKLASSDLKIIKAMFERAGVVFEELSVDPNSVDAAPDGTQKFIKVNAKEGKANLGYSGFFTEFGFGADGELHSVGSWE